MSLNYTEDSEYYAYVVDMKLRVIVKVLDEELKRKVIYHLKAMFGNNLQILLDQVHDDRALIITDQKGSPESKGILHIDRNTPLSEIARAIEVESKALYTQGRVVLGIDPGVRIGVALMCANTLLAWKVFESVPCLIKWVEEISGKLGINPSEFKVGLGERWREVISELTRRGIRKIKLVDERNTTKPFLNSHWRKLDKEVQSAIKIALKA